MLNRNTFFIREHVGFMKLSDTYDILDPETQTQLGIAREKPGMLIHILRLLINKQALPTKVFVYTGADHDDENKLLFSIQRGVSIFRARVDVCDRHGNVLGWFRSKAFSLGGAFHVFDAADNELAYVKGDWKGWNFSFLDKAKHEIGAITKKWAGIGKEFFTSADNYMISLHGSNSPANATLLLAAGLAVDIIYKER